MTIAPGTKLGPYEVVAPIGAGGMGEVYRARDTKLGREVAIKVLPEEFARDKERVERFEREAKLLASLNHPAIATLYGFENGFLVMELVEGETLAERIAKGPLSLEEAVPLFVQIAEGLEAAHEKGIVHRDLKPSNVKVGPDGKPKILDFGLAKALASDAGTVPDSSHSPTLAKGTALGVIMGTASYMSPEQARGKIVDKRTDIWAFGCCLFETLTGRKTFEGDTVTDVLSAILSREPELERAPAEVRRLLGRCLDKDARSRLRDIGEARVALLSRESVRVPAASHRLAWLVPAVLAGAVVGFLARSGLVPSPESPQVRRASIQLPSGLKLLFGDSARPSMALSPDGSLLVFSALPESARGSWQSLDARLYLRRLSEARSVEIEDTEGGFAPFFSPDGRFVGFFAGGYLKKVPVSGGASVTLCPVSNPWGAEWPEDGTILFSNVTNAAHTLFRVPATGGTPELIPVKDVANVALEFDFPQVLPGAESLLLTTWEAGSFADSRIESLSLETGTRTILIEGGGLARYVGTGHLVYSRASRLLAVPFDLASMSSAGTPAPVLDGMLAERFYHTPQYALSPDGVLVYAAGDRPIEQPAMVWLDATGAERIFDEQPVRNARVSPDGERIAFSAYGESGDIWIHDMRGRQFTRLTTSRIEEDVPAWTADGESVLFASFVRGQSGVFRKKSPQSEAEPVVEDEVNSSISGSPDGNWLVYDRRTEDNVDLMLVELSGSALHTSEPLLDSRFHEGSPRFSPVASLLAYESTETGRSEISLLRIPKDPNATPLRVSRDGGTFPVWSRDGGTLYFHRGTSLMAASVTMAPDVRIGEPQRVLELGDSQVFDVGKDGRFLAVERPEPIVTHLEIVFDWFEELNRLVPTR